MPTSVDFETFYDKKNKLSASVQGADLYIRDPRFNAYMVSVYDGTEAWAGHLSRFNWDALDGQHLLSHNAGFDARVYSRLVEQGLAPSLNIPSWQCTANLSTYLCMRRDLGRAVEFLFGVQLDKSVRGNADGKTWEDLTKEDGGKSMIEYAKQDAIYCWRIWNKYGHLWPTLEKKLSALTIKQCRRGVQIDADKLELFIGVAEKMRVQAEQALPWMAEGKKPTSPKAVAEQCRRVNIPCPPVKSHDGEEAYDEWAAQFSAKYRWVKAYTDFRVINKFITTLNTIRERLRENGTFPFELLYFGAHTGRWSGSGGFNMQNMRKEPLYCDDEGWLITDPDKLKEIERALDPKNGGQLPSWVAYALDIRALFTARPGRKLILSDLSQIEPRVLAWLAGDFKLLELLARGQSPYEAHARSTMKWEGGELKYEDKELYALAKARVLGLGFGCGWKKFITVAYNMASLDITKDDPEEYQATNDEGELCFKADGTPVMKDGYGYNSRRIVKEYREQNPLVTGLWKTLDESFKQSEGGDFEMALPSGRSLRYGEVRRERRAIHDEETGETKWKWAMTALAFDQKRNAVVRKPFYGGLLTENLVQATARDVFGEHLIALDEAGGMDPLWSVHDEAILDCDASRSTKDVKHLMSQAPEWIPGLPVSADTQEAPHYKK